MIHAYNPSTWGTEEGRFQVSGQPGYTARLEKEKKEKAGAWGLLVKYLPHKHGELNLVPQDPRKKPDIAVHT